MTETIPTSCPDLMNPQTSRRLKNAGPHFTEWEKMGSKTWQPGEYLVLQVLQPALQFGHISYTVPFYWSVFTYISLNTTDIHQLCLSKQLHYSQKQVKLRALQSSSHTVLLQMSWIIPRLVLHLSPQNKLSLPSFSLLQWFGLLAHELAWLPAWQSQISRLTRWKAPSLPLHMTLGSNSVFAVAVSDLNAQDSWKSRKEKKNLISPISFLNCHQEKVIVISSSLSLINKNTFLEFSFAVFVEQSTSI